jgi:hypothetical protein
MSQRIRLSRAKGWRLPDGAVNVARPGELGNPFVVGKHGTRAECVSLYAMLLGGFLCLSNGPPIPVQQKVADAVWRRRGELRGRDLACWCALDGKPCHADVLLAVANEDFRPGMLDRFVLPLADAGGAEPPG